MLTYELDFTAKKNLYEQLYELLKADILRGTLRALDKLPSKRNFAKNLGVSVVTVENAYAQLMAEGFIFSEPQKGFFVEEILAETPEKSERIDGTESDEGSESSVPAGAWSAVSAGGETHKSEGGASTESEYFPFSTWAKILRQLLSENRAQILTNSPAKGVYALRKAISKHLFEFRGMNVDPEQIVVGAGTEYLYGLLIQLLGFNLKYGVENPGYKKIQKIYEKHGVDCKKISMDKNGVRPEILLETGTDVIHISPSHHFPTGLVMPATRRYEILGWSSEEKNRYIIEDDYDSEFRFSGRPIPTLQSMDSGGKVIYMNTFTKTLASTIRISYVVLPRGLSEIFDRELSFYSCTVPTIEQFTLAKFIEDGYFEKHLNRMRKIYHTRRRETISLIRNSVFGKNVKIMEQDSGLHFLIQFEELAVAENVHDLPKVQQVYNSQEVQLERNAQEVLGGHNLQDLQKTSFQKTLDSQNWKELSENLRTVLQSQGIRVEPLKNYYDNPPEEVNRTFVVFS